MAFLEFSPWDSLETNLNLWEKGSPSPVSSDLCGQV